MIYKGNRPDVPSTCLYAVFPHLSLPHKSAFRHKMSVYIGNPVVVLVTDALTSVAIKIFSPLFKSLCTDLALVYIINVPFSREIEIFTHNRLLYPALSLQLSFSPLDSATACKLDMEIASFK